MGSGMMGESYGHGMGPSMMGGFGAGDGMSSGLTGHGSRADLNLAVDQRGKISKIENELRRKHWELMGKMQDEQSLMSEQDRSDQRSDAALGKSYRNISELRQQMFDLSLGARLQIDSVLTKEQREKLANG